MLVFIIDTFVFPGRSKNYNSIHRRFSNHSHHSALAHNTTSLSRRPSSSSNSQAVPSSTHSSKDITIVDNDTNHNNTTAQTYSSTNGDTHSRVNHFNHRSDRYGSYRSNGAYSGSAYRRRPFSSNNRYYGGNTRSTFRIHRTADADGNENGNEDVNKENETKTMFNEGTSTFVA